MSEAREACVHHWMVESPNGPTSKGTCKLCGSERDYYNVPPEDIERNQWKRENNDSWAYKQSQEKLAKAKG